jgi:hypothetical protein
LKVLRLADKYIYDTDILTLRIRDNTEIFGGNMSQEEVAVKSFKLDNLSFASVKPALFYLALFAGVPLIAIAIFLLAIQSFDLTAMGTTVIFALIIVSMYIFVPRELPGQKKSVKVKKEKALPKVPEQTAEAFVNVASDQLEQKRRKSRSRLPEFEAGERKDPFVEVVKKTTQHPSAQPQVRRKTKGKGGKKSVKKKR